MYESRIAADHLTVATTPGFPPAIDALADCNLSGHGFLRAAWYRAGAATGGRTLLLRRGDTGTDGTVIAAIPTAPFGPVLARARKVPGAYWPFRSPLIAPDCNAFDLAHALLSVQTDNGEAEFNAALKTGNETMVKLHDPLPVHLVYFTAYPEGKGRIGYRRDVYGRDAVLWRALEDAGVALGPDQG